MLLLQFILCAHGVVIGNVTQQEQHTIQFKKNTEHQHDQRGHFQSIVLHAIFENFVFVQKLVNYSMKMAAIYLDSTKNEFDKGTR